MKKILIALVLTFSATHIFASETATKANEGKEDNETNKGLKAEEPKFKPLYPTKLADKNLATPPAKPELVGPTFLSSHEKEADLAWKASDKATAYHLQVATDPNFKWLVVNEQLYKKTDYKLSNLEAGKHYYWRVAALKEDNVPTYMRSAFATSMFATK